MPTEIQQLNVLEVFNLANNKFCDEDFVIGKVSHLKNLVPLDVSGNGLWETLPEVIFNKKDLELLDLRYNSISGTLSSLMGQLSQLKILYLHTENGRSRDYLSGEIPSEIGMLS